MLARHSFLDMQSKLNLISETAKIGGLKINIHKINALRLNANILTYIHNWSLQPFSQDYWHSFSDHFCWFKVDSEQQIFWEIFPGQVYLLSEFFPEIRWEEIAEENTFCILFWCLSWGSNPGFTPNKPTHYLLDYGDWMLTQNVNS